MIKHQYEYGTEEHFRERTTNRNGVDVHVKCHSCLTADTPCDECEPLSQIWMRTIGPIAYPGYAEYNKYGSNENIMKRVANG